MAHCSLQLFGSSDPPTLPKTGSHSVAQAGFKVLASSDPPALAFQSTSITGMSYPPGPTNVLTGMLSLLHGEKLQRPWKEQGDHLEDPTVFWNPKQRVRFPTPGAMDQYWSTGNWTTQQEGLALLPRLPFSDAIIAHHSLNFLDSTLWEAKAGESPEVRSSRPAWSNMMKPYLY
ncbi:hypothetical protein AAY473_024757 [Plecturocebus cupreus]